MGIPEPIEDIQPFAELAQNATTVVYKAYQASLERFVLLKRLRSEFSRDEDLSARFQDEARIVARVQHPNVVAIYAYGSDAEGAYMVAEFVEGVDLEELTARGRIPPDVAVFVLLEAARGLKAAHDKDVLHRDLKPSNILISHDGEVKLADFGLASVSGASDEDLPEIRGTLPYLAPEQILGEPIDRRCDLFSLGATFYEMITGRRAFAGSDTKELLDAVLHGDPTAYLAATPGVTPGVEGIAAKLLARRPEERYGDAGELISSLETYREQQGVRIRRQELKAFLEDPEPFAPAPPRSRRGPDVRVVPDRADEKREAADGRGVKPTTVVGRLKELAAAGWLKKVLAAGRLKRSAAAAAALLVMLMLAYASVQIFGRSGGEDVTPDSESLASADSAEAVGAGTSATDSLELGPIALAEEELIDTSPEEDLPPPRRRTEPPASRDVTEAAEPPAVGTVAITTEPWASVFIDGDSLGRAGAAQPLVADIAPGRYELMLSHPDFPRLTREVLVRSGEQTPVEVSLWSLVGLVDLQVSPWAHVYVDAEYVGETPLAEPLILIPGVRELRLVNPPLAFDSTYYVTVSQGQRVTKEYFLMDRRQ